MKRQKTNNKYNGFKVLDAQSSVEYVNGKELSAKEFFENFINKRKPCILRNVEGFEKFDLDLIKSKSGDVVVDVEYRSEGQQFGKGLRKKMKCSEFCEHVKDEMLYMTTQEDLGEEECTISQPLGNQLEWEKNE